MKASLDSARPGPSRPCGGLNNDLVRFDREKEEEEWTPGSTSSRSPSATSSAPSFYRDGLGLDSAGVIGTEFAGDDDNAAGAVWMFHLNGGLILALYPRTELAKDAQVPLAPPKTGEFSIGHLAGRKQERRGRSARSGRGRRRGP
jgi:hypothetical protein